MARVRISRRMIRKDGNAKATLSSSMKVTPSSTTLTKKIIANVNTK